MGFIPSDYEFQDYEAEAEGWSIYKVEDGTFVKLRLILCAVSRAVPSPDNPEQLSYNMEIGPPIIVAMPKPSDRGNPSTSPPTPEDIIKEDIGFTTILEPWNTYRLKDGTRLSLRLVATKISRTSKFAPNGFPIYFVDNQMQQKAVLPPELKTKQVVFTAPKPKVTV